MIPSLDQVGRWLLPRLDAVVDETINVLCDFQVYVQAWRRTLHV